MLAQPTLTKFALALVASALLAGCGKASLAPSAALVAASTGSQAQSTATLEKAYRGLYAAVFQKLDANDDKRLDEYEASAAIDVNDFKKADKNGDGMLTNAEFMNYAIGGTGTFGFLHQTKDSFLKQARAAMQAGFIRLDKNKDRLLDASELNDEALAKVDMNLKVPALHINVHITELDEDVMTAADHTEDGKLTQAEWEDYCVDAFIKKLNPNYSLTGNGGSGGSAPAPADDTSSSASN